MSSREVVDSFVLSSVTFESGTTMKWSIKPQQKESDKIRVTTHTHTHIRAALDLPLLLIHNGQEFGLCDRIKNEKKTNAQIALYVDILVLWRRRTRVCVRRHTLLFCIRPLATDIFESIFYINISLRRMCKIASFNFDPSISLISRYFIQCYV